LWRRRAPTVMETESVTVDEGDPPVKKHEEAAGADAARAPRAEARTACMDVKVLLAGVPWVRTSVCMYWGRWGPDRRGVLATQPLRGSVPCASGRGVRAH
jgi:hypothetical protein